ncbi:MAG: UDP-N-acetylglucosamine 1-carboxyvinyltransferase [Verrucomicrobiota bacterium]|jgi:UDP-N-acetylglucosamine 1-carboxyvinyltransferase
MDSFVIEGGTVLRGEVEVSGSKNAVLPIMAATLLTRETCVIHHVPDLSDVRFMCRILQSLGAVVTMEGGTLTVRAENITGTGDYDLIRKMRGSICILGPLVGRLRKASVSLPGGCVIGTRPIDLHLKGLSALGTEMRIEGGYVHAEAPGLRGTTVFMGGRSGPTVLGTANVVMASVLAEGVTVIESAACEPEVVDLCDFLNAMGARIHGAGSPTITVTGVPVLAGVEHRVIPDRIEAGTFAVAAVASGGEVTLRGARPDHLGAVLEKLREAGARVERRNGALTVGAGSTLRPLEITTMPYSGFPTDMQAQFMALLCLANGTSIVTERIFESRFMHAAELLRLGADIGIEGPSAIIKGGRPLSGAEVMASDLRASAALVIAGMAAQGRTQVHRVYHLDRGYERMELKLAGLGARIERTQGE